MPSINNQIHPESSRIVEPRTVIFLDTSGINSVGHLSPRPDKSGFKATGAWGNWFTGVLYTYHPAGAL